jgi:hypothetical protein
VGATFYTLALAAHLLSVNLAASLPWFALLTQVDDARQPACDLSRSRRLARISMHCLLGGSLLGLSLGGLMWLLGRTEFLAIVPRFSYKIYWAITELGFFGICMLGYQWLLPGKPPVTRARHWGLGLLCVLSSTNLIYHFPPLFSVMKWASQHPDQIAEMVGPREFRQLMFIDRQTFPLMVHFGLASLAVGGVFMLLLADRLGLRERGLGGTRTAATIAMVATAAQMLVGPWLLLSLPTSSQHRLMGEDAVGTGTLLLSIVAAFSLLNQLAAMAFGEAKPRDARRAALCLLAITVLMTGTLVSV